MKIKFLLQLLLTLTIFTSLALAETDPSFKIATVDVNKILNQLDDAKEQKTLLDQKSNQAKQKIEKERMALKTLEEKIKAQKLAEDSKEVENFRTKAREYERQVNDAEEDIRREFLKINKFLTEKVLSAVKDYAQSNNLKLVLDKSQGGKGGPVLFGTAHSDITDEILKTLNK